MPLVRDAGVWRLDGEAWRNDKRDKSMETRTHPLWGQPPEVVTAALPSCYTLLSARSDAST